jgi:hypothetical protein
MMRVQNQSNPAAKRFFALVFVLMLGTGVTHSVRADEDATKSKAPGRFEFIAKNLLSTARGMFHEWRLVESHPDLDQLDQSFAVVEVTQASVDTGSRRRCPERLGSSAAIRWASKRGSPWTGSGLRCLVGIQSRSEARYRCPSGSSSS